MSDDYTDDYTDDGHDYVSVACWHAQHGACDGACEWCDAACRCGCHEEHAPGSIGDLIEQSSFGGPENQAMRARTPNSVAEQIMDGLRRGCGE